ncbi:uncharacterized protein LOC116024322 [Ipomoea triloba]|uniref:uncharacterized protein LOC116024322 n=1 Tax=Ipomoea triloba TaxID=35885 RepID=UPI00125D027E|nr:uncharacterized protein LOC116024322 [Ipomoea triloba]
MLKLNVDAAIDQNRNKMGFGFVIHDSMGCFITARCLPWRAAFNPPKPEVMGIRKALKWIRDLGIDNLQLESDCQQAILGIFHSYDSVSYFDILLDDVRYIASSFVNLSFLFAKRSTNRVAHCLARESLSMSNRIDCFTHPFPSIAHVLSLDST